MEVPTEVPLKISSNVGLTKLASVSILVKLFAYLEYKSQTVVLETSISSLETINVVLFLPQNFEEFVSF